MQADDPQATRRIAMTDVWGWPFHCMAVRFGADWKRGFRGRPRPTLKVVPGTGKGMRIVDTVAVSGGWNSHEYLTFNLRAVPLEVMVLPMIANSLILGSAVAAGPWIGVAAIVAARRACRARRGCCSQCGYSRVGIERERNCPECGGPPTIP